MFSSKSAQIESLLDSYLGTIDKTFSCYMDAMSKLVLGCDKEERLSWTDKVHGLEHEADRIRHEIIQKLIQGGLLLDARKFFANLIERVDKIANLCEDIIEAFYLQDIKVNEKLIEPILEINKLTKEQIELLKFCVRDILRKYDVGIMFEKMRKIEALETDVDKIEKTAILAIYEDGQLELAEKNQLRDLIRLIAHIADIVEDTSDEIEILMMTRRV